MTPFDERSLILTRERFGFSSLVVKETKKKYSKKFKKSNFEKKKLKESTNASQVAVESSKATETDWWASFGEKNSPTPGSSVPTDETEGCKMRTIDRSFTRPCLSRNSFCANTIETTGFPILQGLSPNAKLFRPIQIPMPPAQISPVPRKH
ncbi:hypothetical protein RJ639_023908 [Escallonia herrerae]|uniref:Uncharacterized protein n=1 Tax=Escallonia herrerae TaxID=1293975 RepID=A0AA88UYN2_9ASTE|nr:hypothetical protein RJ639_023908 [Escallonia herrerae]